VADSQKQIIQWFPGHMAKTRRQIKEVLPLVDLVAEIIDARIPVSSRNPELAGITANKPRIILLNKCDLADEAETAAWIKALSGGQTFVLPVDSKTGIGINQFIPLVRKVLKEKLVRYEQKGMAGKTLRVMIAGIPNVGKSSFINCMVGRGRAKVENRPGVTRDNQWYQIGSGVEMLDTPGVLWPKFEDQKVGEHLAFTGAVKDSILDVELLAVKLLKCLSELYPDMLKSRYKLSDNDLSLESYELLEEIGRKRGMKAARGLVDTERAANMLLEEYRNCKIGRMTLERSE
jgi:ribosome biogenesis GTPase A